MATDLANMPFTSLLSCYQVERDGYLDTRVTPQFDFSILQPDEEMKEVLEVLELAPIGTLRNLEEDSLTAFTRMYPIPPSTRCPHPPANENEEHMQCLEQTETSSEKMIIEPFYLNAVGSSQRCGRLRVVWSHDLSNGYNNSEFELICTANILI